MDHIPGGILLITGPPGSGKTTLLLRLLSGIGQEGVVGFVTREVRSGGERTGFQLVGLDGRTATLAAAGTGGGPKVGKYRVDVPAFEDFIAPIPFLNPWPDLAVIDEIGKMECLSPLFRTTVDRIIGSGIPLIATIALSGDGFIGRIRDHPGAVLITVLPARREEAYRDTLREAGRLGLGSP
jgi:nucleoside-triphosphatase